MFRMGLMLIVLSTLVAAQPQQELRLPRLSGEHGNATKVEANPTDPAALYRSRREAAAAALQAGYRSATVEANRARAMRLLLISLRRDPFYGKALFNLGVLCAKEERWSDAVSFYQEAAGHSDGDAALPRMVAAEIERLELISRIQAGPGGRKTLDFDRRLVEVLGKAADPIAAAEAARELARADTSRWEGPAALGVFRARAGLFKDAAQDLVAAARLAPDARRPGLESAVEAARREAGYAEQVRAAEALWEKQQYADAAQLYAKAWEAGPSHPQAALDAAVGFLLSDQLPRAVQMLARLEDAHAPGLSAKAKAMLAELGAVSEDARREAARAVSGAEKEPENAAARIAALVGPLKTAQMEIVSRSEPALLGDNTAILPIPDDELKAGQSDTGLLSTESVFALYQRTLPAQPAAPATPVAEAPPVAGASAAPAATPAAVAPTPAPAQASKPGKTRTVTITSNPAGATVVLRGRGGSPDATCKTPCSAQLTDSNNHLLTASLPGYRDHTRGFDVDPKHTAVNIELEARSGVLHVVRPSPELPGLPIFINGKETGKQTPAAFTLAEGEYEISVRSADDPAKTKVSILDGERKRLQFP
jgi:tetratricopeptide (TPR) repeat protein